MRFAICGRICFAGQLLHLAGTLFDQLLTKWHGWSNLGVRGLRFCTSTHSHTINIMLITVCPGSAPRQTQLDLIMEHGVARWLAPCGQPVGT